MGQLYSQETVTGPGNLSGAVRNAAMPGVEVTVGVDVAVKVGVAVEVGVEVAVAVGVSVPTGVAVSVGDAVAVSVGLAVGVEVGAAAEGFFTAAAATETHAMPKRTRKVREANSLPMGFVSLFIPNSRRP